VTEWDDLTHEASAWEPDAERLATAHLRQAPSFLIIGTQKGGTSSLHHYLSRNNSVRMAIKKEVHFFDSYFGKGLAWYLAHFARRKDAVITGEASPSYLMHPLVPRRVHGAFPQMRLIALLRNPVDRAYSHYQMNVRKGIEALSFEDAVEQEPSRLHDSDPDAAGGAFRRYS